MNWNDIVMIIYFNFIPVAVIGFASWLFIELVKREHKRR